MARNVIKICVPFVVVLPGARSNVLPMLWGSDHETTAIANTGGQGIACGHAQMTASRHLIVHHVCVTAACVEHKLIHQKWSEPTSSNYFSGFQDGAMATKSGGPESRRPPMYLVQTFICQTCRPYCVRHLTQCCRARLNAACAEQCDMHMRNDRRKGAVNMFG